MEATGGLGMRLQVDLGMRLLVAWEGGYWWPGNEATGGLGMRLLVTWE